MIRREGAKWDEANVKVMLTPQEQEKQKISDDDIITLARLARQLEEHYQFPQDIEWAKENGQIFIVQTRPVTTLKEVILVVPEVEAPILLTGAAASPGIASGPAKIVTDPSQIDKVLAGDILVVRNTEEMAAFKLPLMNE